MRPGFEQAPNLVELVRHLRNAISHCNLKFLRDSQNQIFGVRVWDVKRNRKKTWEADLTLDHLRGIAQRFTELIVERSNFRPAA